MSLNGRLDVLPRVWFGAHTRRAPAFRTCGIAGFYLAVLTTLAAGLLSGRSVLILAAASVACALSFFAYAIARKWITGFEQLVLLEQVWFAELVSFGFLYAIGAPPLAYLDAIAVGLCFFLVGGRAGCTVAGCCHGRPSSVGMVYGKEHAENGFPEHLVGVRLFPVQLIEAFGLLVIGVSSLVAIPFAEPGTVFVWFLVAYAVMRFGLEGLRGDVRPHLFGLSQSRWMAIAELAVALVIAEGSLAFTPVTITSGALLFTALACALVWFAIDPRRRSLSKRHLDELRAAVHQRLSGPLSGEAQVGLTSRGVSFAVSKNAALAHVSLSLRDADDLLALTELAGRAFPELELESAVYSKTRLLHFQISPAIKAERDLTLDRSRPLYGRIVRVLQRAATQPLEPIVVVQQPVALPVALAAQPPQVAAPPPPPPPPQPVASHEERQRYFGQGAV
jgi:hypothetical protein